MRNPAANIAALVLARHAPTLAAVDAACSSCAPVVMMMARHRIALAAAFKGAEIANAGFRAIEQATAGARAAAGLTPVIAAGINRKDSTDAS